MSAPALLRSQSGGILRLTLNRPERLNAVGLETMTALAEAMEGSAADPTVRAIILGATGQAFCTGADLTDAQSTAAEPADGVRAAARIVRAMISSPKPIISAVNGAAAGVGASIALAADIIVAADDAYVMLPFVPVGLMPDGAAALLYSASAGRAVTMRLALTGDRLKAPEALARGLVSIVVPSDDLGPTVDALAIRLAEGPAAAIAATKRAVNVASLAELEDVLLLELRDQTALLSAPDFAEGVAAFAERRPARFSGSA